MKLEIDIPSILYQDAKENRNYISLIKLEIAWKAIADGKPIEQEPRKGQWIKTPKAVMGEGYMWYCNKCEHQVYQDSSRPYPSEKYCSNCGCRMVETQEVRDK